MIGKNHKGALLTIIDRVTALKIWMLLLEILLNNQNLNNNMIRDIMTKNEEVRPSDRTLALLHQDFPQCFNAEGNFDLAKFSDLLNDKVDLVKEGSGFNFLGKN